jgi:hypothetical protein
MVCLCLRRLKHLGLQIRQRWWGGRNASKAHLQTGAPTLGTVVPLLHKMMEVLSRMQARPHVATCLVLLPTTRNLIIYYEILMTILENIINMHDLWRSQYFYHGSASLDIRRIILWRFIRFIINRPIILWHSFIFITDEQPFVTFYKIHHGWRTNSRVKFIMDEESIVESAWTHLSFIAYMTWTYHVGPTYQIGTEI